MKTVAVLCIGVLGFIGVDAQAAPAVKRVEPQELAGCRKLPGGKQVVRLNLRRQSRLPDLISFVSTMSCTPFVIPAGVDVDQTFTMAEADGRLLTTNQMYELFVSVLNSKGLNVQAADNVLRIVPAQR